MRFSASGRSIVSKRLKQDSFQGEQFVPMFSGVLRENERSHKGRILKQTQRREQRRELFMTCADYIVLSET